MHRNLIVALILTSIVWIVWFTWIAPPPKNIHETTKEDVKKSDNLKIININIDIDKTKKTEDLQTYELKTNKTRYVLNSDLSIKELYYKGPVQEVNLIIDSSKPFLSTFPQFTYTLAHKKDNTISVVSKTRFFEIKKTIALANNDDELNVLTIEIKNTSKQTISIGKLKFNLGPGLNTVKSEEEENPKLLRALYAYEREGRKNPVIEQITSSYNKSDYLWTGIDNRYFIFAIINNENNLEKIEYNQENFKDNKIPYITINTNEILIEPGKVYRLDLPFYAGPKDYDILKKLGKGLHLSIDFGFFAPLAKIANKLLKLFYSLTHNYGVSIILLSIFVQILMLPLTYKSYKAMAIMKKMQPEMKSIQERYKKDPQRMNYELMQLYKKYGANPFSGCWPMLIQIPIFFALFTTLRNSWNLHGAKFVLWIKDLSDKDPYFALPIIMGVLMFLQNKMNPQTTTDPTQNVIMKWMPIIFTFLFLTFPSGLVLYWIVNSVFSIILSYYMKRRGIY